MSTVLVRWAHTASASGAGRGVPRRGGAFKLNGRRAALRDAKTPAPTPEKTEQEHLFGRTPVLAALLSGRRTVHRLWIGSGGGVRKAAAPLIKLARERGIAVEEDVSRSVLGGLAGGARVHNGIVALADPLDAPIVRSLGPPMEGKAGLALLTDRLEDGQNLGAVLRTAAFFAPRMPVVVSNKHAAQLTPMVSKASAGAMESLPLVRPLDGPVKFVERAKADGWLVVAGVARAAAPSAAQHVAHHALGDAVHALAGGMPPRVLLLVGNEGAGVRSSLLGLCDVTTTIDAPAGASAAMQEERDDARVIHLDSLNVGVATGVLVSGLADALFRSDN